MLLSIFFDFSSTALKISLFLCSSVRRLTWAVLNSSLKIEEFFHKMAIPFSELKNWPVKSIFPSRLNWPNAQFSLFTLNLREFACSPFPWFHCALWWASGLPRKLLNSPILSLTLSLILPHYACCWPKHNSRRRSLSMLVPRKKWTVPQLTGVNSIVRVPRHLDCTLLHSRSLSPRSNKVSTQTQFSIWLLREMVNEDNEMRIGDTKKY